MKCLIIDAVHSAIAEELSKYMQVDTKMLPTQEELEAAKRSLIATYCSILDVPNQLEDFQFGQNLAGLTFGPDELAEIIRVIDAQQVVEAAQRIQLDTTYFLMGPEGGEEDAQ